MREVRIWGRAYEPGLMAELMLRNPRTILADVDLYTKMLQKMKVGFFPSPARAPRKVKPIPGAADAVAYYPGCSLHSSATEFNLSTEAVCDALGLNLVEPQGWVCCGASSAHSTDPETALRLPMENLALIEQSGFKEVTMPCAACFNRHKVALHEIRHDGSHGANLTETNSYTYQDNVHVSTVTEMILNHVGLNRVAESIKKPLKDLRLVCYYGCLLTRPPEVTEAQHPENPTDMDELMAALGAEVLDWSYKTACCGAAHSLTRPDIVISLSGNIANHARETGAEAIVVSCPLCHMNLDARQFQMEVDEPVPILYFTQLMVLALGLPEKAAALQKNLVDPRPLLQIKGLLSPS